MHYPRIIFGRVSPSPKFLLVFFCTNNYPIPLRLPPNIAVQCDPFAWIKLTNGDFFFFRLALFSPIYSMEQPIFYFRCARFYLVFCTIFSEKSWPIFEPIVIEPVEVNVFLVASYTCFVYFFERGCFFKLEGGTVGRNIHTYFISERN